METSNKDPLSKYYNNSWAIIIGLDKYNDRQIPQLQNAVSDAKLLCSVLKENGFDNVIELYDEEATKASIMSILSDDDELPTKVTKNDRLILFFSGHGTTIKSKKDGSNIGYIVPYDADLSKRNSLIEFDDFVKNCSRFIPAKHILFLMDCCFSGMSALRSVNIDKVSIPKMPTEDFISSCVDKEAVQIITAGGENELVLDGSIFSGHSPFTGAITQGIQSWEADLLEDGILTATELGTFLSRSVSDVANVYGHKQKPIFNRLAGDKGGDFVVMVSKQLIYETLEEYRNRIKSLPLKEKAEMINAETGCNVSSLIDERDILSLSYTFINKSIPDFQLDILNLVSTVGRMFLPKIKYMISARTVSMPSLRGRDIAEIVTIDVLSNRVQAFLREEINKEELWKSITFYVKEPNVYHIDKLIINFPLVV